MLTFAKRLPLIAVLGLLFTFGLAACGDGDSESTTTTTTSTTTSESSTTQAASTTAAEPTTTQAADTTASEPDPTQATTSEPADSIAITYACGNGETGTADIETDDIEEIDDIVNTIDFCEFREGLAEVSFTAPCPSGDREVTVEATDGALPDIATLDLCENP